MKTGWSERAFNDCIVPVKVDRTRQVKTSAYQTVGKNPIIDQGQELISGWTDNEAAVLRDCLPCIVFGDHTRILKFIDFPFALGADGTKLIRLNDGINPRYFYFALLSLSIPNRGYSRHYRLLKEKDIPLPPLPEQKKIAAILLKLQQAIELQGKIIQSLCDLKKSTMQHLFTYGLRGEKTKLTEIGEVPVSWDVVPLSKMGKIGNGSTPKRTNESYWHNGTIPWLTSGKIHEGEIFEPDQFVTQKAESECHLPIVRKGGLLIAITGQGKTLGNAAIVDFDSTMNQHLAYVQPDNPDIHPPYVWQFLTTQYNALRQIGFGGGSTKGALTCADLRQYLIPLPKDLAEQEDIACTLRRINKKTISHEHRKAILHDLFKTTLNKLLTGDISTNDLQIDTAEV